MDATSQITVNTWEDALNLCIEAMKGAAVLDLQVDVEPWLRKNAGEKFNKNFDAVWSGYRERVIAAACAIGQIAHILAAIGNHYQISLTDVQHAIQAVKEHCVADSGDPERDRQRKALCP